MKKMKEMTREEFQDAISATVIAVVGILPTHTYVDVIDEETGELYAYTDVYDPPILCISEGYTEEEICFARVWNMKYESYNKVTLTIYLEESE